MLVLSRKPEETIVCDTPHGPITFRILRFAGNKVRVGIEAPPEVTIVRGEALRTPTNGDAGDRRCGVSPSRGAAMDAIDALIEELEQ